MGRMPSFIFFFEALGSALINHSFRQPDSGRGYGNDEASLEALKEVLKSRD